MRGYRPASVQQDLEKVRNLHQRDALRKNATVDNTNRIPLVLTYHPLNNRIKRILLDNFSTLTNDPATNNILPGPPLVGIAEVCLSIRLIGTYLILAQVLSLVITLAVVHANTSPQTLI